MASGLFKFGFKSNTKNDTSTEDKSDVDSKKEAKERYEKKRVRQFCPKWSDEFPWLKYDEQANSMFCEPCRKYEKEGRFVIGTNNFRIDAIKSHNNSTCHWSNYKNFVIDNNQSPSNTVLTTHTGDIKSVSSQHQSCHSAVLGPLDISIQNLNEEQKSKLLVCFNTAFLVAKRELPFSLYPDLIDLQEKSGFELSSSYRTDKACSRFMEYIQKDIQNESLTSLQNSRFFSIMFDGATDVSVSENEIVYARIVEDGVPRNIFVKIQNVLHAHANGILNAIESAMDSVKPGWNWKTSLIATGSDGASVNLGKNHSVAKLLKNDVPHLVAMHCISHRLELGAIDAMKQKEGKLFADLKTMLQSLHHHYHYSAKALRELQVLAEALDEKMLRPGNLSGTRWMPHLRRCLDVLLQKYQVFTTHFENTLEAKSGTIDVQARARLIVNHLKDYALLLYMHLLKDILDILSELSLCFQRDACGLPDATESLEAACLSLVALHQRPGPNLQSFYDNLTPDNTFKGVHLHAPRHTREQLKSKQDTLIDLVIDHLTKRVGDIESDRLLKNMQVIYPVNLPETDTERAVYGESELTELSDYYSAVLARNNCDVNHMRVAEWPALKVHMKRHSRNITVSQFYNRIYNSPNLKETFSNILMLVEIILCIPVSSAICERGFSAMSRVKSDWRSRLDIEMLNALMTISIQGPSVRDYDGRQALELWWHGGQRTRRPNFEPL